jgi:hypothetical protein
VVVISKWWNARFEFLEVRINEFVWYIIFKTSVIIENGHKKERVDTMYTKVESCQIVQKKTRFKVVNHQKKPDCDGKKEQYTIKNVYF